MNTFGHVFDFQPVLDLPEGVVIIIVFSVIHMLLLQNADKTFGQAVLGGLSRIGHADVHAQVDQKRLFETFHRASNARHVPGTGLGLAIVKQSVELHGGTITFESEENVGTTFTVIIPRMLSEE
jgi:hypothetical protein